MRITAFSKQFWKTVVECKGVGNKNVLRDYDIIKDREKGMTLGQLSIKYGLSEKQIHVIINKY